MSETMQPPPAQQAVPSAEGADPLLKIREERESGEIRHLREQGRLLLNVLYQLVRNFQIYEPANSVFDRPMEEFERLTNDLFGRMGGIELLIVEGQPYLGDLRIRQDSTNATIVAFLTEWLQQLGLGGWSFSPPSGPDAIRSFFYEASRMHPSTDDPVGEIQGWTLERGVDWAVPMPPQRFREEGEEELEDRGATATRAAHVFEHGVAAVRGFFGMLEKAGIGSALAARKAVNSIVDMSGEGGQYALAISLLSDLENPLFTHSMHVANLSVAIGRHLQVPRELLAELGLCGLFHDTGFGELPDDFGWARDADPEVRSQNHPLLGFRVQLRQRGYHEGRMLRAVVNLEHHLEIFHRGQDAWDDPRVPIHPFSRIVGVADAYDTLSNDTESRRAYLPPAALEEIWKGRGTRFDPVVVQALVNIMGRYPFGTLLELDDGSLVVVVERVQVASSFGRPVVRVAEPGSRLQAGELFNLASVRPDELAVVQYHDPRERGIDLVDVLFPKDDPDAVETLPNDPAPRAEDPWASVGAGPDAPIEIDTPPLAGDGAPLVDHGLMAEDGPGQGKPAPKTDDLLVSGGADPFASDPSPWEDSPANRPSSDGEPAAPAPWVQHAPAADDLYGPAGEDPFAPLPGADDPKQKKKDPDDESGSGGPPPPLG